MICWLLLVPAGVPVLVSFSLFFLSSGKGFCSIMICWFLLVSAGFPCLSPFFSLLSFFRTGVLFHHDLLLVPAGVPVFVSLLLSSFYPQERGSVPSRFPGSSWFGLGSRCLSPFFPLLSFLRKGVPFHHKFPGSSAFWRVPVLVSLLLSFPQQRKLMGSSAQNSSGVNWWCRRRVRFNEVPEKVLGGLGARPARSGSIGFRGRFWRRFREVFGAEPGQVQQGSEEGSVRLWCRARSGSTGFRRRFRGSFQEAFVQRQSGSTGSGKGWVAEKVPGKVLGILLQGQVRFNRYNRVSSAWLRSTIQKDL